VTIKNYAMGEQDKQTPTYDRSPRQVALGIAAVLSGINAIVLLFQISQNVNQFLEPIAHEPPTWKAILILIFVVILLAIILFTFVVYFVFGVGMVRGYRDLRWPPGILEWVAPGIAVYGITVILSRVGQMCLSSLRK
jgi:hypothetical protein